MPPAGVLRKHKRRKFPTFGPGGIKTEEKLGECHVRGREGDNISVRNSFQREGGGGYYHFMKESVRRGTQVSFGIST